MKSPDFKRLKEEICRKLQKFLKHFGYQDKFCTKYMSNNVKT